MTNLEEYCDNLRMSWDSGEFEKECLSAVEIERRAQEGALKFKYPLYLQHPASDKLLVLAYTFEYWSTKGILTPRPDVIVCLRSRAHKIRRLAKRIPEYPDTSSGQLVWRIATREDLVRYGVRDFSKYVFE